MQSVKGITVIMGMVFISCQISAQVNTFKSNKEDGVYRTYRDFKAHHFTDSLHVNNMKGYMKDNGMDQIVLKDGKRRRVYSEGEIYGYTLNGKNYRYFESDTIPGIYGYFEILETNGLIIYRQLETRDDEPVYSYYYSKDLMSPVKTLAKHNLKYELTNKNYVMAIFGLADINEFKNGKCTVNVIYNKWKAS